jgi:hypothetical protein
MNRAAGEARYQSGDTGWEKGAPSPGLVDFLAAHPELRRGSVCVPGCGTGHDVRAWAQAGFAASGFDLAPSARHANGRWTAALFLLILLDLDPFWACNSRLVRVSGVTTM